MPDDQMPAQPQPPEGMQRPGIPGSGNLLDPAVRGELREKIHQAAHGAGTQMRGQQPSAPQVESAAAPTAPRPQHRAGPFPHGDVDLSFISANVPPEPVKPRRARGDRRFYFLSTEQAMPAPTGVPLPAPPDAAKPG